MVLVVLVVVVDVDVVVVVVGAAVVLVVVGATVVVVAPVSPGAFSSKGTAARRPPMTYTAVPVGTVSWNQPDVAMGMRTQPCDAG